MAYFRLSFFAQGGIGSAGDAAAGVFAMSRFGSAGPAKSDAKKPVSGAARRGMEQERNERKKKGLHNRVPLHVCDMGQASSLDGLSFRTRAYFTYRCVTCYNCCLCEYCAVKRFRIGGFAEIILKNTPAVYVRILEHTVYPTGHKTRKSTLCMLYLQLVFKDSACTFFYSKLKFVSTQTQSCICLAVENVSLL